MALSRKNVAILLAASLLLALVAFALAGCNGSSASTTVPPSGQTTASSETSTSFLTTTTSDSHKGAAKPFATIGQVMEVEQGQLSVSKVTVTVAPSRRRGVAFRGLATRAGAFETTFPEPSR